MTEGYEYETDQLLSEVEGEGGEEEEEPSSSAAQQSLAAVLREDSERGQSAAVGLEGGSGAGSLSTGEGGRDWKPVSLFRTLKKSWFLKELVMVLRLSVPMVRICVGRWADACGFEQVHADWLVLSSGLSTDNACSGTLLFLETRLSIGI